MQVEPTRILLVEDDPLNVELLELTLDSYNFVNQMDVVYDGEEALYYLLGKEGNPPTHALPHLVLLDLRLPKINGIQVLQAIRAHPRTSNLLVVALSASQEDKDLNACNALGVSRYIAKPLDFEQFIGIVSQVGFYWMLLKGPPLPPP